MTDLLKRRDESLVGVEWPDLVQRIRARTPARVFVGRSGAAYRSATQLDLRAAHAAARDAVRDELNLNAAFGADFVQQWNLREFHTRAMSCSCVLRDHTASLLSNNRDASLPLDPVASRMFEEPGRRSSSEEAVQGRASIQLLVVANHAVKIEPAID